MGRRICEQGPTRLQPAYGRQTTIRTVVFAAVATLAIARPGTAANFNVTNSNDSGAGSFRQALVDSNTLGGSNTITFSGAAAGSTVTITSGDLPAVVTNLTINANGATLNGNAANRGLFVYS